MRWQLWETPRHYHIWPKYNGLGERMVSDPPPPRHRLVAEGECDAMNAALSLLSTKGGSHA